MDTNNQTITKLWNFKYIYLLVLSAITSISYNMVAPIVSKYAISIGSSLTIAGVIAGSLAITALIARPMSGAIADKFNKKWVMTWATLINGIAVAAYGLTGNVAGLMVFRFVHGISFSISGTTNTAFASSFIPRDRMGEGIGYLGFGFILAAAIGPSTGLWVTQHWGYEACFIIAGGLSITAAILMANFKDGLVRITRKERQASKLDQSKQAFQTKKTLQLSDFVAVKLLPLAAFGAIFSLVNGLIGSFLVLIADERHIANIGTYFLLNAFMLFLVRLFSGKIVDARGTAFVVIPGYVFSSIGMLLIGGADYIGVVLIAAVFTAIGGGAASPAIQAECIKRMPHKRGVATSTYFLGADVGQGIGPVLGGAIAASFGYQALFNGTAVLLLCIMCMFIVFTRANAKVVQATDN